ncbi:MAG: putative sulfate exporter family transporter [Candidatus Calescibacterium sp.]|nr:putative sulfate exporter family transporter [Candidatus Calescibacterium sp.]MCX7971991.1 putative sulfate exporter family transporter [bacterium]MDW8195479.1 putative sulfate exporter family transporter [Candidatus Calescibacterium sp.]
MAENQKFNKVVKAIFGVENIEKIPSILPGLTISVFLMLLSIPIADALGKMILKIQGIDPSGKSSPISSVLVAIILGIIVANTFKLSDIFKNGIEFSLTKILRLGIVFVGIKLSINEVLKLGFWGIPIVAIVVFSGLIFIYYVNKVLKLPEKLGTLIAAGTSICGVTAIVSVSPAIKAENKEIAYAVANVTIFGLLAMFLYPYIAKFLFSTSEQIGLFLGTAIHETSQVVGAALTYKEVFSDDEVFKTATVTKLTRNLFLILVVPLLAFFYIANQGNQEKGKINIISLIPTFILGFIGMAILRSIGDISLASGSLALGIFDVNSWKSFVNSIGDVWGSKYLLGTAMAAVGLNTNFSVFKGIGIKPFVIGFVGALFVGIISYIIILILGPFVNL